MTAAEGHCWLCSKYGKLTKEHIPPEKAFNDFVVHPSKLDTRGHV